MRMAKCCSWVVERRFRLELVARPVQDSESLRGCAADWSVRDGRFGLLYCTACGVLYMFNCTCGCTLITALISPMAGVFLLKSGNFKI